MSTTEKDKIIVIGKREYRDFMMGADPELRFKGIKATDCVQFEGKFGTDGPHSQIGELRPDPKFCPVNLSWEIESILRAGFKSYKRIQNVPWLAGSMQDGQALGGHVHFGTKHTDPTFPFILDALDKLLAPVSLMLENSESAHSRRSGTGYGKLACDSKGKPSAGGRGFETKDYGGFEYRSPASWIVSRQITTGILALSKVIAFEAYNMKHNRHFERQLKCITRDDTFMNSYSSANKKHFITIIPTIHRIVSSFALYPRYEKYINVLFQLIYQGRDWNDSVDMKKRWSIVPTIKKDTVEQKKIVPLRLEELWTKCLNADEHFEIVDMERPETDRVLF